ncbi:hypothetical protein [Vibrio bivalvicida]|uniref:Uncharacterized protein n=1 Tax=Vibrio bivalvicida TaxID=1276888 RepID=A0A177Y2V2_9VIBR|nr:hypothetical protein [Vibrio bivalvicida]OAJ95214.1 hypothetical protein APB76_07995 [Vibrio bivalvicida]
MKSEKPRNPIQFIRPNRDYHAPPANLTVFHALQKVRSKKLVQVLLDNCSIQRMERIYEYADSKKREATKEDVKLFGLAPLLELLENAPIVISASGLCEMPGGKVGKAHRAYERFCAQFWPTHSDDKAATHHAVQKESIEKKVNFNELDNDARRGYGLAYLAFMHYQQIYRCFGKLSPEKKFEAYLYGMIEYIDVLSAFELEVVKYLFWDPSPKVLEGLPMSTRKRKQLIKRNFGGAGTRIEKCRELAFDRAMDVNWLIMGNISEDNGNDIDVFGERFGIECWIGTTDEKLFDICKDIHSTPGPDSSMNTLVVDREEEMSELPYWRYVDGLAKDVLFQRNSGEKTRARTFDYLPRIDAALSDIERNLIRKFDTIHCSI